MDAETSALVTACPVDENRSEEWFTAIRAAWDAEQSDLQAFLSRLAEDTGHLTVPDDHEQFRRTLDDLGGDPLDHLRRLAEHEPDELAAHLAELSSPPADSDTDRFAWVRPDQAERMAAAWGDDWPTALPEQLDYRWGDGWDANPDDHKVDWLDAVLAELVADPVPDEADRFGWVPAEQADRLASAWGQDWQQHLGDQLDHRWGGNWAANPDDHKAAWLPDVVDELLTPAEDIPAQPTSPAAETTAGGDFTAEDVKSAVDAAIAEVPGAESLSEEELAQVRAEVAEALAREGATR